MKIGTTIKFGLLQVGVNQHSIRNKTESELKLANLCDCHHQPYKQKKVCSIDGKEQPYKSDIKGYKTGKNSFVELQAKEIEALQEADKGINIICFTPKENVSYSDFVETFTLEAINNHEAYMLLRNSLIEQNKIAICRSISRGKERLALITPYRNYLQLVYLERHNDIEIGVKDVKTSKENSTLFSKLVEKYSRTAFNINNDIQYDYMAKVQELIEKKMSGEIILTPTKEEKQEQTNTDLLKEMVM